MALKEENLQKNLKSLIKTSFIVFVSLLASKALVYIYKIIIAKYLGPEYYGLFSLALVVSGLIIVFASLGLFDGIVRYVALYRGNKKPQYIAHVFKVSITTLTISGIISAVFLFLLSETIAIRIFHSEQLIIFLKAFSIVIPLAIISDGITSTLRAYEKMGWYSFISYIFHNIIKIIAIILLLAIGFRGGAIAFSYVLGTLGSLIIAYLVFRYKISKFFVKKEISKKEKRDITKELFKYSIPTALSAFIFTLFGWTDSFLIGYFKSPIEVGFYNAAVPIAMLLSIVPELFMKLFAPLINKEYSKGNTDMIKELSKQVVKWIYIVNIPMLILFLLFPGAAINILFGKEYLPAVHSLQILSIAYFISSGIGGVCLRLVSMTGRAKTILINTVVALALNVILNVILIPLDKIWFIDNTYGLAGAAIATLLSLTLMAILLMSQNYKYLSFIPLRRNLIKIAVISLIPMFILLYLRKLVEINIPSLIVLSISFFLIYFILIILTKGLDRNDHSVLMPLLNLIKNPSKIKDTFINSLS